MENDEIFSTFDELILNDDNPNTFSLQYPDQKLKNNPSYEKWRQLMLKKYGNDAKEFKCIKDNILFYTSKNDYEEYPYYKSICPKCEEDICYFCSKVIIDLDIYNCCFKRAMKCLLYKDGFIYISNK